jgi:hypothetical protein
MELNGRFLSISSKIHGIIKINFGRHVLRQIPKVTKTENDSA